MHGRYGGGAYSEVILMDIMRVMLMMIGAVIEYIIMQESISS